LRRHCDISDNDGERLRTVSNHIGVGVNFNMSAVYLDCESSLDKGDERGRRSSALGEVVHEYLHFSWVGEFKVVEVTYCYFCSAA